MRTTILSTLLVFVALSCGSPGGDRVPREVRMRAASMIWTDLPGTAAADDDLQKRLLVGVASQGEDYLPRTHHLHEDGKAIYVNRLVLQSSPYLLQHAHNPVNWHAWDEEAFEKARTLDRPILLSIGYSTCHWCHVMERESFEDLEIAEYINSHYIPIKVDREERPDVDSVYMDAVRAMTGRGGWPLTAILTPDREPFFGGTYFPARDGDRGPGPGFLTILQKLEEQFRINRQGVTSQAKRVSTAVAQAADPGTGGQAPRLESLSLATARWASAFDPKWGGFGNGQKFPRPSVLSALMRHHLRTGDPEALQMVSISLDGMMGGGIRDHLGGGFHRYTVERSWLVPHFEKMLYDNAQLAVVYLEASQITGRQDWAEIARETLDYVTAEMSDEQGGFYSATDADSPAPSGHDEEGWFFTWTPEEVDAALGAPAAAHFKRYYGVSDPGNFEGRTILSAREPLNEVAAELELEPEALQADLRASREVLYALRAQRPPPGLDDKVLVAWNGLMISAFARAGLVLQETGYTDRASTAAEFILGNLRSQDGRLLRSWRKRAGEAAGVLDDYAFLQAGLLDLFEATGEARWLTEALALQTVLDKHFLDEEQGGYFLTADDAEVLLVRQKPDSDGALPAGNSIMASNLLRLAEFTSDDTHRKRAEALLQTFSRTLRRAPTAAPQMLCALDYARSRSLEIVLVTPADRKDTGAFLDVLSA
ncbi:MAG: thioredoxin domain-containing protein, partial [Myxococcota bacterium]|nr:thioredoxin domain-containing protein [Myxococcota bacterium]